MLNIPRLRSVLKKLETSSDLAKFLLQRATAVADTINKEHGAAVAVENLSPRMKSPTTAIVTSLTKSVSPPITTGTHTLAKKSSQTSSAAAASEVVVIEPTKNELIYTEEETQMKTITAAIASVSLFSSIESNGGAAKVISGGSSNLRENSQSTTAAEATKESQTNYKMSDAKIKEVPSQTGEDVTELNQPQDNVCNGTSCASGSDQQNSSAKSCFKSSLADILHFMELVGSLKHTKRTGWVLRDVNDCESISGHMYRMSMMTFLLDGSEGLNQIRCMELALVHDLAESLVGDLTPFCGVAKEEKKAMELKAMEDICKLIEPRGKRIMELFEEYEEGKSAESKFVKDLDRLDMVMQAFEYEKRDNCLMKHQEFFDSTEGKFQHPFVQKLVKEIYDQRKSLVEAKIIANGNLKLKTVTPNCPPCLEHKNERS